MARSNPAAPCPTRFSAIARRTPETGIAYKVYAFDLGDRIREAASRAGQAADLIGFRVTAEPASGRLSVLTYWQARARIVTPLRVFAHAIGRDGELIAQDDRLDARGEDWRPGDLLAQISRLGVPRDPGPVWIEIGLYNPDSGERVPVALDGQPGADRLLLDQVAID